MPRLLIVNADDFGLSAGVNEGIIETHTRGVLTSTSLMVDRPAAEAAVQLAAQHPALSVGLHLDADTLELDDPEVAASAFAAQLERFRELRGVDPTHVDSHHHVHASAERLQIFAELVRPIGVPLRHDGRVRYLGGFWGQSEAGVTVPDRISRGALLQLVRSGAKEGFSEIGCHPARLNGDLRSSYLNERAIELDTLTSAGVREEIEAMGVSLVSYLDWPSRSKLG